MIKRLLILVVYVLGNVSLYSQNFEQVDATLQLYPSTFFSDEALAARIERDFDNTLDKVAAAYGWLINNVAYEPKEYNLYRLQYRFLEERNQKMETSRNAIITRTLSKNIAVCEGYALTLERLCNLMKISAYVVRGDVKTQISDINRPFAKTHMWLVVLVDGKAMLIDPTWGAGRYEEAFVKAPSYRFFNTDPAQFIKTHYPEVWEDAYLDQAITRDEFIKKPLIISEELTWDQTYPKLGAIKVKTLKSGVTFKVVQELKDVSYSINGGPQIKVEVSTENNIFFFTVVTKAKTGALIIYEVGKPILGYKLV